MQMGGGWVLSISSERDRATVLNTESGLRTTHRFPCKMDTLLPLWANDVIAFYLKAPEIRQVVVFNIEDKKWYLQDLNEATTFANPVVGPQEASYEFGRFLYIFSTLAKKWSTLELKQGKVKNLVRFDDQQTGKRTLQEGTILHIYDPKTGEWTHNDTNGPDVETPKPSATKDNGPGPEPKPAADRPAVANPQTPQPRIITLGGELFLVISAELDRLTMINASTQERKTLRLPKGMTEIVPIDSGGSIEGLHMKGPQLSRVCFYDRYAAKWFEHELKETATEVWPMMSPTINGQIPMVGLWLKGPGFTRLDLFDAQRNQWVTQDLRELAKGEVSPVISSSTAIYRIGRFLYIYSAVAGKWSVLELKREDPALQDLGQGGGRMENLGASGKLMVTDGDVIHIYDVKTGDWTHIDTKDEK
jgi:hypothetical protein